MATTFYELVYLFKDISESHHTDIKQVKKSKQKTLWHLEMDPKTDAKSESHKIVNALNKQSLKKIVLGFASASRYKCQLLLQTLLRKLSTQQHDFL